MRDFLMCAVCGLEGLSDIIERQPPSVVASGKMRLTCVTCNNKKALTREEVANLYVEHLNFSIKRELSNCSTPISFLRVSCLTERQLTPCTPIGIVYYSNLYRQYMKLAVVENSVKFTEPQWLGSYELEELWASFACEQRKKHSTTGGLISYSPKILSEQCLRDSLSALIRVRFNNAKLYFDKVTEQLLAIVLSEHPVSCLASTNEKVFMKLED